MSHRKRSLLWFEIKQHRASYILSLILSFLLWGFPVGFLQSWPSLVRDKSFPEWLAEKGWPSITKLAVLWLAIAFSITLLGLIAVIVRLKRVKNHENRLLSDNSQEPEEHLSPESPRLKELERRYEVREIEPNLIFRQYSMVGVHEEHGKIVEGNNGRNLTFHAVVAEFNNRVDPERTTAAIDNVSATLTYTFFDKRTPIEITRGVWLSHGSKVAFGINDTNRLMIATLEGDFEERYVFALNGSYSASGPKRVPLTESLVKVNVALVAESQSKVIKQFELMLEIRRDSEFLADLKVTELTRWKHDRLFDLLVRGTNLLNRCDTQKNLASYGGLAALGQNDELELIEREANLWASDASKFLATHFDQQHQLRFIGAVSTRDSDFEDIPRSITSGVRVLYDAIKEVGGLQPDMDDVSRLVKTFGPIF